MRYHGIEMGQWRELIEKNLQELIGLQSQQRLPAHEGAYLDVLVNYLQGDLAGLASAVSRVEHVHGPSSLLAQISKLRLGIRERKVGAQEIRALQTKAPADPELEGEALFVCGLAWEILEKHEEGMDAFESAGLALERIGALHKALKARFNSVANDSRIHPHEKRLIPEFKSVAAQARHLGERGLEGNCALNISREYQKLGARQTALRYAQSAVECLEAEAGSVNHYQALAQRCDLNYELGRNAEAELDWEACTICNFPEILSALEVIRTRHRLPGTPRLEEERLTAAWRERLQEAREQAASPTELGEVESQLIDFLCGAPATKKEIFQSLYPGLTDPEVLEN
jgi:tetratricopeptide (TPR) repeat protein